MNKFQKFIAAILIIGLVLSLNFNLFIFKPKSARAIPVLDVLKPSSELPLMIKDLLLDTIGHTITQTILTVLKQKIMDWGMGRKTATMQPFQVIDWQLFFAEAVNRGSAKFVGEFEEVFDFVSGACEQGLELKRALQSLGFGYYYSDLPKYSQYARPTLEDLGLETCQAFVNSGYSLLTGGWTGWFNLTMRPQNNIFGQVLMAEQARRTAEESEKEAADKQTDVSGGYRNEETTTATDVDACKRKCAEAGPPSPDCLKKCERLPGVVIQKQIKNWGSDINKLMTKTLGADMDRLISVDEITELLGVIYSALINKAMNIGLGFASSILKPADKSRIETKTKYSYQRAFKKQQTIEDIKDVQSETLVNILKSIQQLSRSITTCKDEEMMKYDDFTKNIADIFSPSVEALYIGLEGVNLKPDFEVLDPLYAPYSVYGYSWGHVPISKFPNKCKQITDQVNLGDNATCRRIKSGLEPNFSARCDECIYDHDAMACPPAPIPPLPYPQQIPEATIKAKQDFYNACRGWYLVALDHCDECLKKVDEKCSQQLTDNEKLACIEANCSNYDYFAKYVVSPPTSGLDFHNKCLIEEKKDACYTCLKEYFIPATYCEQTKDYVARSLIKYPALVKKVRNNAPDHEIWIGPYDKIMGEQGGGECDNNDEAASIDLGIICRIMPDFSYGGEKVCETKCSQAGLTGQALTDALKDITDFRPYTTDCGSIKLPIGGTETWAPVNDGVFQTRDKCCAALWQHDARKYAFCVGSGATTEEEEPEPETACLLDEGEMTHALTTTNVVLNPRHNAGLISTGIDSQNNCVILKSTERPKEVTMYVAEPYCDAYRDSDLLGNIVEWWDIDDDGAFSNKFLEAAFWAYCCNDQACTTFKKQPPSDKILCTFDVDGVVGTPNGPTGIDENGQPYKVCCGLSGYETSTYPQSYCSSTPIPADVCNDNLRFRTGGLYLVAVPDQATSLGGAEWCACENPSAGCGFTCQGTGCSP